MRCVRQHIKIAIGVSVSIFTLSMFVRWISFEKFSADTFGNFGKKSLPPRAPVRDYVLNYSQTIKPPIQCVPFSTISGNIPICVHDNPGEYITSRLKRTGFWEPQHSRSIQNILVANPDYGFIDIGANLGMFSLLAANLQRPSLAVEAMDINIERFHQSIVMNHFEKYITVVTRPLSDKYVTIRMDVPIGNLGAPKMIEHLHHKKTFSGKVLYENKATMMLDDLIDLMPRKKAIMVIDVEGSEGKVIRGGQKFFDAIHISHIFMEWNHLSKDDGKFLVDFLSKRGYKPYHSPLFNNELNCSQFTYWHLNVFWRK